MDGWLSMMDPNDFVGCTGDSDDFGKESHLCY